MPRPDLTAPTLEDAAAAILALCAARGPDKSICPSEAARRLAPNGEEWRAAMPMIRAAAADLALSGAIEATQRGAVVDALTAKGPIRLRLGQP